MEGCKACLPARIREEWHYHGIFLSWVFFGILSGIELSLCIPGTRLAQEGDVERPFYWMGPWPTWSSGWQLFPGSWGELELNGL